MAHFPPRKSQSDKISKILKLHLSCYSQILLLLLPINTVNHVMVYTYSWFYPVSYSGFFRKSNRNLRVQVPPLYYTAGWRCNCTENDTSFGAYSFDRIFNRENVVLPDVDVAVAAVAAVAAAAVFVAVIAAAPKTNSTKRVGDGGVWRQNRQWWRWWCW